MLTLVHFGGSLVSVPEGGIVTVLPGLLIAHAPPVLDTVMFVLQSIFWRGTHIAFVEVAWYITQVVNLSCVVAVYQSLPPESPDMTGGE